MTFLSPAPPMRRRPLTRIACGDPTSPRKRGEVNPLKPLRKTSESRHSVSARSSNALGVCYESQYFPRTALRLRGRVGVGALCCPLAAMTMCESDRPQAGGGGPQHATRVTAWMASDHSAAAWMIYFNPITIESGPTSGSTRILENPASRIQVRQSSPV
jgi:hypothetical protein